MTTPAKRPRIVDAAFWTWIVAAVLLLVSGFSALTVSAGQFQDFFQVDEQQASTLVAFNRGIGVLCVLIGLGIGYVAGKIRNGDRRFRRAGVALSAVAAILLAGVARLVPTVVLPVALLALVVGLLLICLPKARAWYAEVEKASDG